MSDDETPLGPTDDLGIAWDPGAARLAWVLVAPGRIEILLVDHDLEWIREALATAHTPTAAAQIVIGCRAAPEE